MANAKKLAQNSPARVMLVGYPGAGKTGALASLANKGYKLRILAYDKAGNMQSLLQHVKPEFLENIDIVFLEDKLRSGDKFVEPVGIPEAFAKGLRMLDQWKYAEDDGTVVDLGASKDWGPDTIVVLDSLTAMGVAAFRRARKIMNKSPTDTTRQVWMFAMDDQDAAIEKLCASANRFHLVVTAHLKMITPKDIEKGDTDLTQEIKKQVADLIPARLYPSALGQQLPQQIARHFSTVLLVEQEHTARGSKRVIKSQSGPELDLKLPALKQINGVDISDGLASIFEAITGTPGPAAAKTEEK